MSNPFTLVVRRLHADARPAPVRIPDPVPAPPAGWSAPRTGGVHWQRPAAGSSSASYILSTPAAGQ